MFYVSLIFNEIWKKIFSFNSAYSMKSSESTSNIHDGVRMTEYKNEPFIIGDYKHNQIEFMHLTHRKWYTISPYPFQTIIFGYGVVSRPSKVFILGGWCEDNCATVTLFENDSWSKIGNLAQNRLNHMVITYGTDCLVIGGQSLENQTMNSHLKTEMISLVDGEHSKSLSSHWYEALPSSMLINGIVLELNNQMTCGETKIGK